jgi:hypothetical protein
VETITLPLSSVYWLVGGVATLVGIGGGMIVFVVRLGSKVDEQGRLIAELVKDLKVLCASVPLLDVEVRRHAHEIELLRAAKHSMQRRLQALAPVVAVLAHRADIPFADPGDVEI